MTITLRADALCKTYTRKIRKAGFGAAVRGLFSRGQEESLHAVSELGFAIERGERVGLIGENGAGKSTTLKMLTGILVPSSGKLEVLGLNPWRQRRQLAGQIGVVFGQRPQLLWDIPVSETFSLLRTMYRIPKAVYDVTYQVLFASLSFRFVGPFAQQLLIPLNLLQASRYPLPVYPGWLQKLLLFVLPYGTIHYLPGRVLFAKSTSLWGLGAAPVAALVMTLLAQAAWSSGLRQYESTGS